MKKYIALLAACLSWTVLPAQAAFDAFLKLEGVPGEATASGHKDEIVIESFSMGITRPAATGGGGTQTGRPQFSDISFTHRLDKASPILMLKCASGTHIPTAVLTCRSTGARQEDFYIIRLTDVLVTSVSISGASGGDVPFESFSLNYTKIEWEYIPQLPTGGQGPSVRASWDLENNTPITP
jgi:type VI secretion system secreted protein Hcp